MLGLAWVRDFGVRVDGIEAARSSDDAVDALVGSAALLRCVLESRPSTRPGTTVSRAACSA